MEPGTEQHRTALADKASRLPATPGVYLMKDRRGVVLYVGKAKALRARVRSYFQKPQADSLKTQRLVAHIADFDTIAAPTEKDALILENDLIKKHRPRFNVLLRDDKEYPYLCLTVQDTYPTLTIARRPRPDGSRYYGPFPSAQAARETLRTIHRLFPLRKCSGRRLERRRPCVYHQLGQCPAPCARQVDPARYRTTVRDAELFLQGRNRTVIREMKERMAAASDALDFERAARLRDRIAAIAATLERQTLVCRDFRDRDVFALHEESGRRAATIIFIRACRVIGARSSMLAGVPLPDDETLASFAAQYYDRGNYIPDEILMPLPLPDATALTAWLQEKKGSPVVIICPRRGFRKTLVAMALDNAALFARRQLDAAQQVENRLQELAAKLGMTKIPERIACVDISTISGTAAAGSLVVFQNGSPDKSSYRRFRITSVQQQDDYAMIRDVLTRYLTRARTEQTLPDLIVVDGGKGQLAVLTAVLRELGITGVGAAALAKGRGRQVSGNPRDETVFVPGRKNPVALARRSGALLLLQQIRDEAHRFAVAYHTRLRTKHGFASPLTAISGIGAQTARALLQTFGSIDAIRRASVKELQAAPSMNARKAAAVVAALRHEDEAAVSGHLSSDQMIE